MRMRDVMRPARWTVARDTRLRTAERIMARYRIRHLPVVEAGQLVGLLTEQGLLDYRARVGVDEQWWRSPVSVAMHIAPETAGPDDPVSGHGVASSRTDVLPIIEAGLLVGMVYATDVLDAEVRAALPPAPRAEATAADAMTESPWTVRPTDSLIDAAKLMVDYEVRHLPVVENGRLVGMLSDRDIRTLVGDPVRYVDSDDGQLRVRDAMTRDPITVTKDRPIREIATELIEDQIGALPVTDRGGALVGIISYVDALRALAM